MRDRVKLRVLAVVAALVLAACGGDGESATPESSTSAPSSTTTTFDREAEEQAVIDAYLAELDAFYAAANPPDPDHPDLEKYATGRELAFLRELMTELTGDGIAIERGAQTQYQPVVKALTDSRAIVEDCVTDADRQVSVETGEPVDEEIVFGRLLTTLRKLPDGWKVERSQFTELETPCAA